MNRFCCWVGLIDIRVLTVINTGSIDMETGVDSTYLHVHMTKEAPEEVTIVECIQSSAIVQIGN